MAVLPFGLWDVGESFHQTVDYEEEEEDQYEIPNENKEALFQFSPYQQERPPLVVDNLIICYGDAANTFVETYFDLPNQPIAELINKNADESTIAKQTRERRHCFFYKLANSIFCLCKLLIKQEDTLACIEKIVSSVNSKRVAVLCSIPKCNFQGNDVAKMSDMDVLRSLSSSTFPLNTIRVPQVEEGNIIESLPAAALSYCEHFKLPCVLYINYTESHFVDAFSLKTFQDVFNEEIMKNMPKVSKETVTYRLKTFEGIGVADNNLYV